MKRGHDFVDSAVSLDAPRCEVGEELAKVTGWRFSRAPQKSLSLSSSSLSVVLNGFCSSSSSSVSVGGLSSLGS
jgi:hypothetical protein